MYAEEKPSIENDCLITDSSIANIAIGMTIKDAKRQHPLAVFKTSEDGDGARYLSLLYGNNELLWFSAHDAFFDNDEVNENSKIEFIQTFNPICHTASGIKVGTTIEKGEKTLGKVKHLTYSEIESREYVEFENQPKGIGFRINYCGIFEGSSRQSKQYQPGCEIFAISLEHAF